MGLLKHITGIEAPRHVTAHQHSTNHRHDIVASKWCGCFHCLATFRPSAIYLWRNVRKGNGQTALCPNCGTDAVIGDKSGYPITDKFLRRMKRYWF